MGGGGGGLEAGSDTVSHSLRCRTNAMKTVAALLGDSLRLYSTLRLPLLYYQHRARRRATRGQHYPLCAPSGMPWCALRCRTSALLPFSLPLFSLCARVHHYFCCCGGKPHFSCNI